MSSLPNGVDNPTSQVVIDIKNDDGVRKLSTDIVKPLEITINNIGFSVPVKTKAKKIVQKVILKEINGIFKAGRLTAVMGASGAGKTSLLNVLAGEIDKGVISGEIRVNGYKILNGKEMKNISGFVFQDDVILETMTVKEAVMMSARLRLPKTIPLAEKEKMVDDLLEILHLTKAANTIIGSSMVKGVSGGERKRTALAMEMITNPSLLFLDEPTSGLDTFTAFNVVEILKNLAQKGRTVIATIHQPSSETFHMFDDLCLLSEGRVMYFGPIDDVVEYFAKAGYQCPTYTNPADYLFMSILNPEKTRNNDENGNPDDEKARLEILLKRWDNGDMSKSMQEQIKHTPQESSFSSVLKKYHSDFGTQFSYLFVRAGKNALRNKFIVKVKFAQSIFIALLIGLIYFNVDQYEADQQIQNITGCLFFISVNMIMGSSIGVLSIFAGEKAVFIREYKNGYYSLASYFFSKTLVELPFQIIFPIVQTLILYWMVGLSTTWEYNVPVFMCTVVLLSNCGTSLGIFFASLFSNLTLALAVTPMVLLPLMIFSGLFVNNGSIPVYFDWIKYISPIKWGFESLVKNQFKYWSAFQTTPSGATVIITGDDVIKRLSLDDGLEIGMLLLILLAMYVGLLSFAYVALSFTLRAKK